MRIQKLKTLLAMSFMTVLMSPSALAANYNLTVVATGISSEAGSVRAVLCTKEEAFPNTCAIREAVPAKKGVVKIEFKDVPEGEYAFAAFHDENDDGRIDSKGRMPSEGLLFSNNAMGRMGPPSFKQSAFELLDNKRLMVQIRYLQKK
ncbi:DUF2141 domain-containing protein [Paraneptunicella aestuarii]|uniref:DUF2141 domain-containing protein n=1 Tax=Paraneptunicella aestuarii TaxID=2831148 RepID=UPI001E619591|nr:DUF2141 domain-containing protein [Paraneptunicella aestuarii]UAA40060.1 DUF2141 domain-containing protein [Paraneptunicella aestuarii]